MLIWSENWSGKFFGKSGLRSESKTMESGSQEENLEMGDVLSSFHFWADSGQYYGSVFWVGSQRRHSKPKSK